MNLTHNHARYRLIDSDLPTIAKGNGLSKLKLSLAQADSQGTVAPSGCTGSLRGPIVRVEGGGVEPLPLGTLGFKSSCVSVRGTFHIL